jgi:hypothetical protein
MLRTLGRIACIFLFVGVVAGGLYLLVSPGVSSVRDPQGLPGAGSIEGRFGHGRGGRREARSPGHGERGRREEASLGEGVGGMAVTAIQVGSVAAVVAGIQARSQRRRHARAATARTSVGHAD